jgi:hypothetical protein
MTDFAFLRLTTADNSWDDFLADWRGQCEAQGEEFSLYEQGPIQVVRDLAEGPLQEEARVYGLKKGKHYCAMCQVNRTLLPGYNGKVLRVRMMYLSPYYDFGDYPVEEYTDILISLFGNVAELSYGEMESPHIKFHLRSPADRQFFATLGSKLDKSPVFASVALRGAWLYITKN